MVAEEANVVLLGHMGSEATVGHWRSARGRWRGLPRGLLGSTSTTSGRLLLQVVAHAAGEDLAKSLSGGADVVVAVVEANSLVQLGQEAMSGAGRDAAEGDVVHNVEDGRVGDGRGGAVDEEGVADGQLGQVPGQFEDVLADARVHLGEEQQEVAHEAHDRGRVDHPIEAGQDAEFHLLDVRGEELSAAEVGQRRQLDLLGLVELDGDVEGGEGREEGRAAVAPVAAGGQVAIEQVDADGDGLAGQLEVIDDAVGPVFYLLKWRRRRHARDVSCFV